MKISNKVLGVVGVKMELEGMVLSFSTLFVFGLTSYTLSVKYLMGPV